MAEAAWHNGVEEEVGKRVPRDRIPLKEVEENGLMICLESYL